MAKRKRTSPTVEELEHDIRLVLEDREVLHDKISELLALLGQTRARNVLLSNKLELAKQDKREAQAALLLLAMGITNHSVPHLLQSIVFVTQKRKRRKKR